MASLKRGNPALLFADESGVARAGIDCFEGGPSLFLRDRDGEVRIGLDFEDETDTAFVTLMTPKQTLIELSAGGREGTAKLNMFGDDKTVRVSLTKEEDDGASIVLAEKLGRVTFLATGGSVVLSRGDSTRIIGIEERQIDA